MLDNFKSDLDRYSYTGKEHWLYHLLTCQGVWASAEYRYSNWVHRRVKIRFVRQFLKLFGYVWYKIIQITTGIDLPESAVIGKGLYIGHYGQIIVAASAVIGDNCNISQGVTIGAGGRGEKRGCPTLGDRVYIGPGAKIFGAIKIGNDVAIGANAVVTKDLPDNAVAVGVPAKIISYDGSGEFVWFRGKPK